jgi:molecular chaperone GrpE
MTTENVNGTNEEEKEAANNAADSENKANGHSEESDNVTELKADENGDEQADSPEEKKGEGENFKEKYYYLAAEMENMRRRHEKDRQNLLKYGSEKILNGLLEVVDNLDRTADAVKDDDDEKMKNLYIGIDMVRQQFSSVLKDNGVSVVESLGKIFDPNFHEAMAQQPAEGKKEQEIINEYQKGYILNGRLLRAAKVIVAKND